ncbi:hypothetical protein CT0861_12084 [Colletotrichum tofieldiae]|uniref:DUF6546 domain-containing protein n=1 Tax=Colletotrichum tofieldiae TaxID=708197 RepID=A0A166YFD3_9PEZI|nr:hypothetical protein CT0861_12084 [Colletotrichum tofieldiae]
MGDRYSVTRCHGMILRASTRRGASSWMFLPAEIRLMILEAIAQQKHPGWASSASVCKEWQLFIEKRNFNQLKLQVSCLDDFERMTIRRKELVCHIWLDIELPKYTCRCCKRDESYSGTQNNSSIISNGIWKLFRALSTWKPASGLTLELNAHSPSDSDHWFKNYYFASADEGDEDATSRKEADCSWHDPQHGWINGQQVTNPPRSAIPRLFGMIDLRFREELPQVDGVTCFIIRRQLRRCLFPRTLKLILNKLCRLEHLIYEPWRAWECGWRVLNDRVFEDFSDNLAVALGNAAQLPWQLQVDGNRIVDPRIGAAFAPRSLDLEQLSVSYMVNAEDFLQACMPTWTWQRLQSLALTSQLLRQTGSRLKIDALLYKAGITALQMPRLHTLVLWNGIKGDACAFIYHTDRDRAYITWRGTWDMELSHRVTCPVEWLILHPSGKYGEKKHTCSAQNE